MTYSARGLAAKEIEQVFEKLNTAQLQWETYATRLGIAYKDAYGEHKKALGSAEEKLRAGSEAMYFVLSLYCVSFAGGLVGGLMAPWVRKAGEDTADLMLRTFVNASSQTMVRGRVQREMPATKSSDGSSFAPNTTDPLDYHLYLKDQIGTCFSILRDNVEQEMKSADEAFNPNKQGHPLDADPSNSQRSARWEAVNYGKTTREKLLMIPVIKDHPKTNDMPDIKEAARQAELGMWIAWANIRDIDYWNTRMEALSDGLELGHSKEGAYAQEARQLSSILDRLVVLGVSHQASLTFTKGIGGRMKETVLHIPKLAQLGKQIGGNFFGKIDEMIVSPLIARTKLPSMVQLPPIFKR